MDMRIISAHQIARYQAMVADMVADKGANHKSLPKKRKGKGSCTRPARRDAAGRALSKHLRKAERKLQIRRQDYAASVNAETYKDSDRRYRKPGSLKL